MNKQKEARNPGKIQNYFYNEKWTLLVVTVTGVFYNAGMTAAPWFEGKLAQYLYDIQTGSRQSREMWYLAVWYVLTILLVQLLRYMKRLYVRKFSNDVSLSMKETLYQNLITGKADRMKKDGAGDLMTKAVSDVDACAEGMRKVTTEVFDTGVVMAAYLLMLLIYDWRLTLIAGVFPPIAYFFAARMKVPVTESAAASKESAGKLSDRTLERIQNAALYRIYGQEFRQEQEYEVYLTDYEKKTARSNIWQNTLQPLYQILSMIGAAFILWFGSRNVLGNGWAAWDIAAFSTFLSCFARLAVKSSKAANLFNAVQKARVSWKRIRPYMTKPEEQKVSCTMGAAKLEVRGLSFHYPEGSYIFKGLSFDALPGQIIGITGEVACGKSTLGKAFLCEHPYEGSICFGNYQMSEIMEQGSQEVMGYMGHDPELFSDSIKENICLGKDGDIMPVLKAVCMDQEVEAWEEGIHTMIGDGGKRLSGGQQARIALARTLYHARPVMILDDPFSAVDMETEAKILRHIRIFLEDRIVLLISHRLTLFHTLDQVIWLDQGKGEVSDHKHLMEKNERYRMLYQTQTAGGDGDEA